MSWEYVSDWIEHHPGLASWVQAVGAVAAIFLAMRIAHRDSRLRRKDELQAKQGSLVRAITVVEDAEMRVVAAFDAAERFGMSSDLLTALTEDLDQAKHYLSDALSVHAIDPRVYSHLFTARRAVEEVISFLPGFDHFYASDDDVNPIPELKEKLPRVLRSLMSMQVTPP